MRILFATDVHGAEKCFRKFINAGIMYKVNALILGGDITGKVIVPIVRQSDGRFICDFLNQRRHVEKGEQLDELRKLIRFSGYYPYIAEPQEMEQLDSNEKKRDELFRQLMTETLKQWMSFAEGRLRGTGIDCYVTGGNDDLFEVESVLRSSDCVKDPEGEVASIGEYEMISSGYSNPTPWKTPRELSEEELEKLIEEMAGKIQDREKAIFNLHVPPFDSTLDLAPKLDTSVYPPRPHHVGSEPVMVPVGSTAVRNAIEKYEPLVGLHGHIHESKGIVMLGRTLCFNPGSEYSEGIVKFVLMNLSGDKVVSHQLGSG